MKRIMKWGLVALAIVLLVTAVMRALAVRKAQQQSVAASVVSAPPALHLSPDDVIEVNLLELTQTLPISGALKAVSSAMVKARVAGELQGLSVREGDAVKAGQVIAQIDPTEINARVRQAQQQAQAARAQVDIAKRVYDNNRSLVEQGFISKTALESSAASLSAAESSYQAALESTQIAKKALDDTVVRTPITGEISQRLAQTGERLGVDARIIEVIDTRQLELEASVSANDSMNIRLGQIATLQIEGTAAPVRARVVRINPLVAAASRAVQIYLAIEPSAGLRQGLFAQGSLDIARATVTAVPRSAVRTDKPQPYVQIVSDQKVRHQVVELGIRGDVQGQPMIEIKGVPDNSHILSGAVGIIREGTEITQPAGGQ